jgi:hypothetical protein
MKNRTFCMMIGAALLLAGGLAAYANPSCSAWMLQQDGSWWRECVNDDGSMHCYTCPSGSDPSHDTTPCYEIKCQ